jgi:putative colanic acid biosynthesis glycosyltransferase
MKILHINTRKNVGGSAQIMNELVSLQNQIGHDSFVYAPIKSNFFFRLGSKISIIPYINFFFYKFFGLDFWSIDYYNLKQLIKKSDIIHLHVLHGFYLNYSTLFKLIHKYDKAVCVTLHDMWYFTGRCAIPLNCNQLHNNCSSCPNLNTYPSSYLDFANSNKIKKSKLLNSTNKILYVSPSNWMYDIAKLFVEKDKLFLINNGIRIVDNKFDSFGDSKREFDYIFVTTDFNDQNKISYNVIDTIIEMGLKILLIGKNQKLYSRENVVQINSYLNNIDVINLMRKSHNFLILSKFENFPTVLIEALMSGCFIVSTPNLGSLDVLSSFSEYDDYLIINGKTDFKITPNSEKVKYRVNKAVKLFNSRVMCEKYDSLYLKLLNFE